MPTAQSSRKSACHTRVAERASCTSRVATRTSCSCRALSSPHERCLVLSSTWAVPHEACLQRLLLYGSQITGLFFSLDLLLSSGQSSMSSLEKEPARSAECIFFRSSRRRCRSLCLVRVSCKQNEITKLAAAKQNNTFTGVS